MLSMIINKNSSVKICVSNLDFLNKHKKKSSFKLAFSMKYGKIHERISEGFFQCLVIGTYWECLQSLKKKIQRISDGWMVMTILGYIHLHVYYEKNTDKKENVHILKPKAGIYSLLHKILWAMISYLEVLIGNLLTTQPP